jgi:peptide/nickel transport system substrate-binding protein
MFRSKKILSLLTVLMVMSMVLGACATPTPAPAAPPAAAPTKAPAAPPTTAPAAPTTPPQPTAVPPTEAPAAPKSKDPTTFTDSEFGEPETLDPSVDYETAGSRVLQNIYEGLITFEGADPLKVTPQLAKAIPDPVEDGKGGVSYTWQILDGVKFHNGDAMMAHDVAFSFWRTMLVGDNAVAPNFLDLEAFFLNSASKNPVDDPTELVDPSGKLVSDPESLKKAPAAKLEAACQQVKDAVTFDDTAGTVTMKMDHKWGPLWVTLAGGGWAYVQDQKWVGDNGDWNGDCKTWQNFYSIPSESGKLRNITNGTGPYILDHWTPGEEYVLTANPDYRKGEAKLKRIVYKVVNEFGTRFATLQAGDADYIITGSTADRPQMDTLVKDDCDINTGQCQPYKDANGTTNPNGILRRYLHVPSVNRTDIAMNYAVAEGSPFVGSGQLDGAGIPLDFFSDINIRKAFEYCFDMDSYIKDVWLGEAVPSLALTLPGQPGYEGTPAYTYDLTKCADSFKASTLKSADGKSVWDNGFYMQFGYNTGNTARQSIAQILGAGLQQVNPKFLLVPVAVPWPTFLRVQRDKQITISTAGWQEDIHDPHNWYVPYLLGTYSSRFNVPADLKAKYQTLITQGVFELDPAKRADIYKQLNQMVYDDAVFILGAIGEQRYYEPLYVQGWFDGKNRNPMVFGQGLSFYELSKN